MLLLPRWLWNRYSLYAGMRVIRKKRISLVYVNTISSPYGYYLARKSSLPFVWHVREFVEEDMQHKFDFGFGHVCKALGKANAVIFNSKAVADKYKLCAKPKSSSVIYNGFDFNGIRPREERLPSLDIGIKLVIAGSIQPGKGQIDAIMASSVLIDKGYKLQLDVIGKGKKDYERYLRRRIRSMGIENNVSWIGRVKDVSGYFCDADAVLVCSRSEAFGRVSVEALALGVPVIASRSGGSIEVMIENEIGLLYEPGDFNDLADKIQELINDRERYLRLLEKLGEKPTLSIPAACGGWDETRAAYRLFDHPEVSAERVLAPHIARTEQRLREHPRVLCIQDTTELDYTTKKGIAGLGPLNYETVGGCICIPPWP
jgi:glycosyltransferase involved in cell wall biosynthesis